jgi:hypothetical protein
MCDAESLFGRSECLSSWACTVTDLLARGPRLTLQEAREFAAERVLTTGRLNGLSPIRVCRLWERFENFLRSYENITRVCEIIPEVTAAFVVAHTSKGRPSGSTQSLRRTALRIWFRILREYGLMDSEPTVDLQVAARARLDTRPLTDDEADDGRWAAASGPAASRATAIWAMAESGMWPAEIAVADVDDLGAASRSMRVHANGRTLARVVPLSDWSIETLTRRANEVGTGRLVFDGDASSGRASISAVLRRVLRRAGLEGDPLITLNSIPAVAARRAYEETGHVEDAARRLGIRSLDRAAHLIALDWSAGP